MFLAIGAVILLVIGVFLLGRLVRPWVRERIACPEQEADFDVVLEHSLNGVWGLGRPLDVLRCSRFPDPGRVSCNKNCLKAAARL
jgi:hypothetical protein